MAGRGEARSATARAHSRVGNFPAPCRWLELRQTSFRRGGRAWRSHAMASRLWLCAGHLARREADFDQNTRRRRRKSGRRRPGCVRHFSRGSRLISLHALAGGTWAAAIPHRGVLYSFPKPRKLTPTSTSTSPQTRRQPRTNTPFFFCSVLCALQREKNLPLRRLPQNRRLSGKQTQRPSKPPQPCQASGGSPRCYRRRFWCYSFSCGSSGAASTSATS